MSQYNPKDVKLNINGHAVSGFSEDSFVKVEPMTKEKWQSSVGAAGETGWSLNNDNRHKITVQLMQNSPSVPVLQSMEAADLPIVSMLSYSGDGAYIGGGLDGRIAERQEVEFGKEYKEIQFVIIMNDWKGSRK